MLGVTSLNISRSLTMSFRVYKEIKVFSHINLRGAHHRQSCASSCRYPLALEISQ
jgi:hypothetical protein